MCPTTDEDRGHVTQNLPIPAHLVVAGLVREEDAGLELAGRAAGVLHADEDGSLVHLAVRADTVPRPMQVVQTWQQQWVLTGIVKHFKKFKKYLVLHKKYLEHFSQLNLSVFVQPHEKTD